ncbi:ComEA family DNA-binding protein [Mesoaciditoga sp.]
MSTKSRIMIGIASLIVLTGAIVVFTPFNSFVRRTRKPSNVVSNEKVESAKFSLINVNEADVKTLEKLPGIGPTKARAIVEYRNEHGSFSSLKSLLNVKGIGQATLKRMEKFLTGFVSSPAGESDDTDVVKKENVKTSGSLNQNALIDINHADIMEIAKLPYIGMAKAKAIVEYRNEHGLFKNVQDLKKVKGIGDKIVHKIEKFIEIRR